MVTQPSLSSDPIRSHQQQDPCLQFRAGPVGIRCTVQDTEYGVRAPSFGGPSQRPSVRAGVWASRGHVTAHSDSPSVEGAWRRMGGAAPLQFQPRFRAEERHAGSRLGQSRLPRFQDPLL
jgi:hypothetical protein